MSMPTSKITLFEHQTLRVGQHDNFTQVLLEALQQHHGDGVPYYDLVHNGVRFNQFVGVIQVNKTIIEVLPKVDRLTQSSEKNSEHWQKKLMAMMLATSLTDFQITGNASLNLKENSILDAYFTIFISEVERLLHQGLIKQYRKAQANLPALKGKINFSQHIRHNQVHKERFFVEYTVYNNHNFYNQILYKTIKLIAQLNINSQLVTRINLLLLNFPELDDIYVDQAVFERIIYTRKNQHYQSALNIAQLILLNYHPDIQQGRHAVLSLMFDMNILWEKFVLASLRRFNRNSNIRIKEQDTKLFWSSTDTQQKVRLKPDIIISNTHNQTAFVLDTKWKCPPNNKPSPEDLRQLYTYHHYYNANKVALVYPSLEKLNVITGYYCNDHVNDDVNNSSENKIECALLFIGSDNSAETMAKWQEKIYGCIIDWCFPDTSC